MTSTERSDSGVEIRPTRLNPTDATLWDIERNPALRTTIVTVLGFDRPLDLDRLRNDVEAVTRVVPRLRQRVVSGPAGVGAPHWELDPNFAVDEHLSFVDAPQGAGDAEITRMAEQMASSEIDRRRPLWHCTYIGGHSGPSALVLQVHHSLTDGVGGVELLDALVDAERCAPPRDLSAVPEPRPAAQTSSHLHDLAQVTRGAVGVPSVVASGATKVAAAGVHPVRSVSGIVKGARSAVRLLSPSSAPLSPLMTARSADRDARMFEIDLGLLRTAAASQGCTINQVFFAGVIGGVTAYHRAQAHPVKELRAMMPVSFRRPDDSEGGNRWAPARFTVPADIDDPLERLLAMRELTRSARREPALSFSQSLAMPIQMLPSALSSGIVGGMMRGVDLTLTNVPGPSERGFFAGGVVERIHALAPTAGAALSVAFFSHVDTACLGVLSDSAAVTAPDELSDLIAAGLAEVVEAAIDTPFVPPQTESVGAASPPAGRRPERLSALDTSFLKLESPETPMHIGGLFVIEGEPLRDADGCLRISDARRHIEARLRHVPRFTKRLSEVPFGLGRPVWVDDERFDIARHVNVVSAPTPGGQQDVLDLCADLFRAPLDRNRPLWELWLIDGMADGHVGIVEKVHHALIDGISGVELAAALFDVAPDERPDLPVRRSRARGPGPVRRISDAVIEQAIDPADLTRRTLATLRSAPGQIAAQTGVVAAAAWDLARPSAATPPAPFNQHVGGRRVLRAVTLDLDSIHPVRQRNEATVNDVVLACMAGALRRWLLAEGEALFDVHVLVPVSTRHDPMSLEPGNRVGFVLVPLPVGEPDPQRRLRIVKSRMQRLKSDHEGDGTAAILQALDHIPAIGLGAVTRLAAVQPFANLVVTNVPGPRDPLYFLGARIEEMIPVVPLGPRLGLGVAVLSYTDHLTISLFADPDVCHDLDGLVEALSEDLEMLAGEPSR